MDYVANVKRLSDRLTALKIPHKNLGMSIIFLEPRTTHIAFGNTIHYEGKWTEADVICKPMSYGSDEGLFEVSGIDLMTPKECAEDSVVGYLSMEEVVERVVKAYKEYKNRG